MIKVKFFKNKNIFGFEILDHGTTHVCAGVSILAFNTINSIEAFTNDDFIVDINEDYENNKILFISNNLKNMIEDSDVILLLKSFELGILGIVDSYSEYIKVSYEEVL